MEWQEKRSTGKVKSTGVLITCRKDRNGVRRSSGVLLRKRLEEKRNKLNLLARLLHMI